MPVAPGPFSPAPAPLPNEDPEDVPMARIPGGVPPMASAFQPLGDQSISD
jgi:lysozyme